VEALRKHLQAFNLPAVSLKVLLRQYILQHTQTYSSPQHLRYRYRRTLHKRESGREPHARDLRRSGRPDTLDRTDAGVQCTSPQSAAERHGGRASNAVRSLRALIHAIPTHTDSTEPGSYATVTREMVDPARQLVSIVGEEVQRLDMRQWLAEIGTQMSILLGRSEAQHAGPAPTQETELPLALRPATAAQPAHPPTR
jgi:hypothetical protein